MRTRRSFLKNLIGTGTVALASLREDGLDRILAAGRATADHRPELLAGVSWDMSRWLAVPEGVEVVAFEPAGPAT